MHFKFEKKSYIYHNIWKYEVTLLIVMQKTCFSTFI